MMLARWQRVLVLLWLVAVLCALLLPWRAGEPLRALPWLALLLGGHMLWLGLTVLLMRWHNRHDPAPPASLAQTLAAWASEVRAAPEVFAWRQPFAAQAEPDFLGAGTAQPGPGVVLVHGFFCNRGLWTPWLRELRRAGVPFVAVSLEPVLGSIDDYPPQIEAAVRRIEEVTGVPPLLVGHSMGGLAIRAWLDHYQADARVRQVLTIGTPHQGTWLARASRWAINARQMRPRSPWLQALAQRETASRRSLFLCLWSHGDNIVFPASNARLPGAGERHVPATGHLALLRHPQVRATLWQCLGRRPPAS